MIKTRMGWRYFLIATLLLAVAGCARHYTSEAVEDPYGFFSGFWHGIIFAFSVLANVLSWLLSLLGFDFLRDIQIIGRPNTGFFYYVGFVFGLGSFGGGAGSASR